MVSKQLIKLNEKNLNFLSNNNICPKCIRNTINLWVKTKKGKKEYEKLSMFSKEIDWILNQNKLLENNSYNLECSVCGNKTVYINNYYFLFALSEIIKDGYVSQKTANEFNSYFISTS